MLSGCLFALELHPFFLFNLFASPSLLGASGKATLASSGGGGTSSAGGGGGGGGCTALSAVSSVMGGGGGGGDGGEGSGMKTCAVLSIATLILIKVLMNFSRRNIQRNNMDEVYYGSPREPLTQTRRQNSLHSDMLFILSNCIQISMRS